MGINAQICAVRSDICRLEDTFALKDEIKQFIFLVHANESNSKNKPLIITSPEWKSNWKKIEGTCWDIPFQSGQKLVEKIEELEDRNLSLIGHFQQSEEEFEEKRHLFLRTEQKLDFQINQLKSHMQLIGHAVDRNIARAEELKFFCAMFDHGDDKFQEQEHQLATFEKEIERVYNEMLGQE